MNNRTDERLDRMLSDFYSKAEPEQVYVFDPDSVKRSSPAPFAVSRRIMAAAGLVLISALSVSLFLFFGGNKPAIVTAPYSQNATTPSHSESMPAAVGTVENGLTEAETSDDTSGSENVQSSTVNPTKKPDATVTASNAPTQSQTLTPTQISTQKPTEQTSATQKPTQKPTQAQPATQTAEPVTQAPTEAPTQAATLPPKPEWPSESHSSGDPGSHSEEATSQKTLTITDSFDTSMLSGGYAVYCRLYTADGEPLGDGDLYSGSHRASINTISGSRVYVVYRPDDPGFEPDEQEYRYEFYNKNGAVLCSGTYVKG